MQTNRPREGDQSATEGGVIGHGWPVETLLSARNAPKRGGAIASDGEGTDPEPWKRIARKIATVVVIKTPDDRALIGSVAQALAAGRVAESDVWEAVESVEIRRPKNAAAWFRACLKNRLAESGRSLDQLGVPR